MVFKRIHFKRFIIDDDSPVSAICRRGLHATGQEKEVAIFSDLFLPLTSLAEILRPENG